MTVLVIAEHDNASIKGATLNTVTAAVACGGDVHVLVAGHNAAAAAAAAAQIAGVVKVLHADDAGLGHGLAGLRRQRFDQAAYAERALSIAHTVAGMLAAYDQEDITAENDSDTEPDDKPLDFNLWMDFEGEGEEDGFTAASSGNSRSLAESGGVYCVFTDEFDTEAQAIDLVRPALLQEYRERLDQRIEKQGLSVARLARDNLPHSRRP